ncbi:MAG: hypothetical protein KDD29_03080 [Flavobacteriales bacterium]|nr:hypothetical protein [Flavobacteriales bacterium]
MLRKLSLVVLTAILMSFALHNYYVTITEGEYNTTESTFQFTIKFIGHDLEKALANAGADNLMLGTEKESSKANDLISGYISKHFQLISNGKNVTFNFVGKEVGNDDFIYCYLESEKIKKFKSLEIKNTLLIEVFPAQENIVYLTIADKKHSFSYNKEKTNQTINLD